FRRGQLTTWGVAKRIQQIKRPIKDHESAVYRTQKIYGVIARKRGSLDRLHELDYIHLKDTKWGLNFPKADAILLLEPELVSEIHPHYYIKTLNPKLGTHLQDLKSHAKGRPPLQLKPSKKVTEELHLETAAKLKRYVEEGIDLDRISNKTLSDLVMPNVLSTILKHARSGNQEP
ncbi:unnamed protein product, partial [marine sediment metagenome]